MAAGVVCSRFANVAILGGRIADVGAIDVDPVERGPVLALRVVRSGATGGSGRAARLAKIALPLGGRAGGGHPLELLFRASGAAPVRTLRRRGLVGR